ncbi:hypothetical protein A6A04_17010 [Paramagnetospirillum marisnigri]|uniref:Core-binding (CB) domain-containing protein n=2 Tax=Paramagnetospirillum marisnigri TaxID=1285242 RepID=A0A178MQA5_9PROT|nr:hypothetical protein A6A04_17010 [Paramagnetospirillum marisnigri]
MEPVETKATAIGALSVQILLEDDPEKRAELEARKQVMLEKMQSSVSEWKEDFLTRRGPFARDHIDVANPTDVQSWVRDANRFSEFMDGGKPLDQSIPLDALAAEISGRDVSETVRAQIVQEIPSALLPERAWPYLSRARSPSVPNADNITLGDLIKRFFADDKRANLDTATRRNYNTTIEIMIDLLGANTPLRAIKRDDIRRVQRVIRYLPPRAKDCERFREMTYQQISEIAEKEKITAIKSGTRNKYIRNIGTLFAYALEEEKVESNPALGLLLHLPEDRNEQGKAPFDSDDLRAMFPNTYQMMGLNWLPLVMLFQGFRPNEAAQLDTADVIRVDGIWVFDLTEETKGRVGSDRWADKSLKNETSAVRRVPIHQKLIDFGFIDYIKLRIDANKQKLFDVKRYGQAGYFLSVQDQFAAWLEGVGVKNPSTSPHSFRHTWATKSFGVVHDGLRKIMGGWTLGKGVDVQTYLHTNLLDIHRMKAELDKVTFDICNTDPDPARTHPGLIATKLKRRATRNGKRRRTILADTPT